MPEQSNQAENAPNPVIELTAEQAQTLLRADLRNLAEKVRQGKTLSAAERNLLQATLSGGRPLPNSYAANQVELAEILGVDRKTVQRHRKIPGNPGVQADGRYDVNAWRAWFNERRGIEEQDGLSPSQLRARQILLQNQKLEYQIGILRKEYVPVTDVEKWGGELGAAVRKVVSQIHLCAPSVVGVSVAEAEVRLKEVEDEVLDQLHVIEEQLSAWKNESAG